MRYLLLFLTLVFGCCGCAREENGLDASLSDSMKEYENRTKYSRLDVETLRNIPDDKLEDAILDYIMESGVDLEPSMKSVAPGISAYWLTWNLESEVNNGGFNQFYWNTEDRNNSETVKAFEFFRATEHASLMRKANTVRSQEAAIIRPYQRINSAQAFSDSYKVSKLGPLDDQFYALKEDLSKLRIAKIRESPELFVGE